MATDENRSLQGLLNGLARMDYYNESDFKLDFLHSELYPNLSDSDFEIIARKARGLMKMENSASSVAVDLLVYIGCRIPMADQAGVTCFSQTAMSKKKDAGLFPNHVQVYLKFWKTHRHRIYEQLVERCMWSNKLQSFAWRIDVMSRSRHSEQLNTPAAIVEMHVEKNLGNSKEVSDVLHFEMDESQLASVLSQFKEIENLIDSHSNKSS